MKKKRRTQAERHQESEEKLIQAAIHMVAERGYDQLRLAELGEAAGFSRSLAAHYFGNRDALMQRVVAEILSRASRTIAASEVPSDDPLEAIFRCLRVSIQLWTSEPTYGRALFVILAAGVTKPELTTDVQEHTSRTLEWFVRKYEEARDAGLILETIDAEAEAKLCLTTIRGAGLTGLTQTGWDAEAVCEYFIATIRDRYAAR